MRALAVSLLFVIGPGIAAGGTGAAAVGAAPWLVAFDIVLGLGLICAAVLILLEERDDGRV